ncbi:histidinol dehydrogenase [Porticoccus sp.]|jgi:histidinol dehydrogenase|nr:histidinol dehydrogenase [Porticoccus sp.]MDC0411716.1 histidinol dehydrogenase [Porticoccus sp.]MDC1093807.1 histidinol dehydrogenase [Porticoccus sp.]
MKMKMGDIRQFSSIDKDFDSKLQKLLDWQKTENSKIDHQVGEILTNVRQKGDIALVEYTNQFDHRNVSSIKNLIVPSDQMSQALQNISEPERSALNVSAERIIEYHEHQKINSWSYCDEDGTMLGQQVTPLERIGIYVPGGKANYPSSVLMSALPAKVAGVNKIIMTAPAPDGQLNPMVLAAAAIAGVDEIYTVGGAQAIGALAYGTDTIKKVDKIVGPGNIFVATAKRMVFGQVGLDMVAGPSEVLIVCDGKTDPDWIAMDLFSQAEHDQNAQAILVSNDNKLLEQVKMSVEKLLPSLERADIIQSSLKRRGAFILVRDLNEAVELVNYIAPEHLELSVDDPEDMLPRIRNAGAIFMGRFTSESVGDYCAGPSHVLPTSSTARFSSPLGVYDFQKRSSIVMCNEKSASKLGKTASIIARAESLTAHAHSAEYRIKK